jgi:hypothetical protein
MLLLTIVLSILAVIVFWTLRHFIAGLVVIIFGGIIYAVTFCFLYIWFWITDKLRFK